MIETQDGIGIRAMFRRRAGGWAQGRRKVVAALAAGILFLLAGAPVQADHEEFKECKTRSLARFSKSVLTMDLLGVLGSVEDQGECNRHLDPEDPETKEILDFQRQMREVHERAIRCGGCNI